MSTFNPKKIIIIMGVLFLVVAAVIIIAKGLEKSNLSGPLPGSTSPTTSGGNLPAAETGGQPASDQTGSQKLEPGASTPSTEQPTSTETTPATVERANKVEDMIAYTSAYPSLSTDGSAIQYYDQVDNKFYKLNSAGEPTELTQKQFFNVQNATWSPDKNKVILEYPDQNKVIYDFSTEKQVSLPKHWEDFEFSPNGQQLVFKSIGYDPSDSWLGVVSSDGTSAKTIEKIGLNADKVIASWSPNNQTIAMYTEGQAFDQKVVYFVGLNGENFKSMTVNGRGFMPLWSPTGSRLLYSVYATSNDMKPRLWTSEAQGETIGANLMPINLETWANKCVFISDTQAYCAVPESLPQGAGFSQDIARNVGDSLYLVDLITGGATIIDNSNLYNMTNLIITNDQQSLYFTDKKSGKLLKLSL